MVIPTISPRSLTAAHAVRSHPFFCPLTRLNAQCLLLHCPTLAVPTTLFLSLPLFNHIEHEHQSLYLAFTGPPREDIPLPTSPPYTAFIGGLAFESTDSDLSDFFSDLSPTSVRLVKDNTGKAKGFGYVEFANLDGLKKALERSGAQLGGRTLRISVAEARAFLFALFLLGWVIQWVEYRGTSIFSKKAA